MLKIVCGYCVFLVVCALPSYDSQWVADDTTWSVVGDLPPCDLDCRFTACDNISPDFKHEENCNGGFCVQCSGSDSDEWDEPGSSYILKGPGEMDPWGCGEYGEGTLSWNGSACQCNVPAHSGRCDRHIFYVDVRCIGTGTGG